METTRLLYVGATRAVQRLVLSAGLGARSEEPGEWREPSADALLHCIWPTFREQMVVSEPVTGGTAESARSPVPPLRRLRSLPPDSAGSATAAGAGSKMPVRSLNRVERHVGTVVHLALEELSGCRELPRKAGAARRQRWQLELRRLGLWGGELERAADLVNRAVDNTLAPGNPGRWLLSAEHKAAHSEWALHRVDARGGIERLVIDRTFLDARSGERWLVDYKTGQPEAGESRAQFLARECSAYREQLLRYRDALHALGGETVRVALYFTAIGELQRLPDLDIAGDNS